MNSKTTRAGVCICADDVDNMVRFYRDTLGLPTYADVDAEYERLMKLGVQNPTGEPKTNFGLRSFFITDPEGNLVEIGSMSES